MQAIDQDGDGFLNYKEFVEQFLSIARQDTKTAAAAAVRAPLL